MIDLLEDLNNRMIKVSKKNVNLFFNIIEQKAVPPKLINFY